MKILAILGLLISTVACGSNDIYNQFAPDNDMRIPAGVESAGGITEQQFNDIVQATKEALEPLAKANNEELIMEPNWKSAEVNAAMNRIGKTLHIYSWGGLARHPLVKVESYSLVMAHEGSHAFCWKYNNNVVYIDANRKICSEALADYNGNGDFNLAILKKLKNMGYEFSTTTTPKIDSSCAEKWERGTEDFDLCIVRLNAGLDLAALLAELTRDAVPNYETRDSTVVTKTNKSYPSTQCRADQYFDGVFHILPYSSCWFKN